MRAAILNNFEVCICAAVRAQDGLVVRGQRHSHALWALQGIPRYKFEQPHGDDQGFVTSLNRYVTRAEAFRLHKLAGIPSADEYRNNIEELFSEDIY